MDDEERYRQYYDEIDEVETRRIVNVFIRREYVTLPKWCWRVFDWMEERGYKMREGIRTLDLTRRDYPLADFIHHGLYCDLCRMMQNGDEYPDFLPPPDGWEDFEDDSRPA